MNNKAGDSHFVLRIEQQGAKTRLADLVIDRYAIGRAVEAGGTPIDFQIQDDPAVSRLHCQFVRAGEGYAIENHSPNGTLVDGTVIKDRAALKGGEKVQIGETVSLTFHAYTTEERAKNFAAIAALGEKKKPAAKGKSLYQQPIFVVVVAVWGLLLALVVGMSGTTKGQSVDPGPGPEYFGWMISEPLGASGVVSEGRRAAAESMWRETLDQYGGELAGVGPNDFRVLWRARQVLRALGYGTVQEARDAGENVAAELVERKQALEAQLAGWYKSAKESLRAGREDKARGHLERIRDAVPKSDEPIRRFAVETLLGLDKEGAR